MGLLDYVRWVAGATLTAVDALRYNISDVAINWDGGRSPARSFLLCMTTEVSLRHHASRARAAGFCYAADCVLAILALKTVPRSPPSLKLQNQADQRLPRVFYLDLDLHFSDVVSSAFTSFTAPGTPRLMVYIKIVELIQRVSTHDFLCLFFFVPPFSHCPSRHSASTTRPQVSSLPLLVQVSQIRLFPALTLLVSVSRFLKAHQTKLMLRYGLLWKN